MFSGQATVATQDGIDLSELRGLRVDLAFGTGVRLQLSADGQTWWYRANGVWTIATGTDMASTVDEIDAGVASYRSEVGARLLWRAILAAPDAATDVGLQGVVVDYVP